MKIRWNGHASFTITLADGTVIVTDPYDPSGYDGALKYAVVDDKADVALISHDHADHNHVAGLSGDPSVLTGPGSAKGIEFAAVATAHDENGGSDRGKNMLFAFDGDGVRVAFMGDLGHLLSEAQLEALGKVDVMLPPVGGTFTLDADGAARLVEQVKPRLVIPMHFKTRKCGFPILDVDEFAKRMTNVKKTGESEVEVTSENLPSAGPEVWILEHAK